MANALIDEALIDQEFHDQVDNPKLSLADKRNLKKSIRQQSMVNAPKNTSLQTILSISNTMVGSSLLIFPVLFAQSGVLSSLLVALIFCLISGKTCTLLVIHNKPEEFDLPPTITRILGKKYYLLYNITNITILYFASVVYFILICSMLYPLVQLLFSSLGVETAQKTDITLSQISFQWCGIVYMCLLFVVMMQEKLDLIIKLVQYGVISVVSYIAFIIVNGSINIAQITNVTLFTTDLATLCGVFSLAFMVHQVIVPIIKKNFQQDKNIRDISISFGWTWLIYAMVGGFGAVAITGKKHRDGVDGSTVLDFMEQNAFTYIIICLQLFQLTTVYPLLNFITRSQFLSLIFIDQKPPKKYFMLYTVLAALSTLIIQCLNISVSLVLSLSGAVIGFFQLYLIPIMLHMVCLYGERRKVEPFLLNASEDSQFLENPDASIFEESDFGCLDHSDVKKRTPKPIRLGLYGLVLLLGLVVGVMNLISAFKPKN